MKASTYLDQLYSRTRASTDNKRAADSGLLAAKLCVFQRLGTASISIPKLQKSLAPLIQALSPPHKSLPRKTFPAQQQAPSHGQSQARDTKCPKPPAPRKALPTLRLEDKKLQVNQANLSSQKPENVRTAYSDSISTSTTPHQQREISKPAQSGGVNSLRLIRTKTNKPSRFGGSKNRLRNLAGNSKLLRPAFTRDKRYSCGLGGLDKNTARPPRVGALGLLEFTEEAIQADEDENRRIIDAIKAKMLLLIR